MRLRLLIAALFLGTPALAQDGPKYLRVVEEDGGGRVTLEVGSRTLEREGWPRVTLVGAVHIADPSFYQQVQDVLDGQALVLYEAVRPGDDEVPADDEARAETTGRHLRFLGILVERHRRAHKAYPPALEDLATGGEVKLMGLELDDAWGRPIEYTPPESGRRLELLSLGADGRPGGEGVAADLRLTDQEPIRKKELGADEGIQEKLANALGLQFQLDGIDYSKGSWRNSDMTVQQVQRRLEEAGADGGALFGLLEGSSVQAKLAGLVIGLIGSNKTMSSMGKVMMLEMLSHADELLLAQPGDLGKMMEVLLLDRNQVVVDDLKAIGEGADAPQSIGVFYGAGHLPDMEMKLVDQLGYRFAQERWLPAISVNVRDAAMTPESARQFREMMAKAIREQMGGR